MAAWQEIQSIQTDESGRTTIVTDKNVMLHFSRAASQQLIEHLLRASTVKVVATVGRTRS